jgi:hypothetical protein
LQVTFSGYLFYFKKENMKFIKKIIAKLVLWIWGWKIVLEGPASNLDRCILAVAPHTANEEYILGNLNQTVLYSYMNIKAIFVSKPKVTHF